MKIKFAMAALAAMFVSGAAAAPIAQPATVQSPSIEKVGYRQAADMRAGGMRPGTGHYARQSYAAPRGVYSRGHAMRAPRVYPGAYYGQRSASRYGMRHAGWQNRLGAAGYSLYGRPALYGYRQAARRGYASRPYWSARFHRHHSYSRYGYSVPSLPYAVAPYPTYEPATYAEPSYFYQVAPYPYAGGYYGAGYAASTHSRCGCGNGLIGATFGY
jgi:hypothetical protein